MRNKLPTVRKDVLRYAVVAAAVFAVAWSLHAALRYSGEVLPVRHVQIQGAFKNVSKQGVREQVLANIDGGYFTIDLHTIREGLLSLPWVEDASVRRLWPATLDIQVTEKQAIAYWSDDSLLSSNGELFSPRALDDTKDLPRLDGPSGLHLQLWKQLGALQARLQPLGLIIEGLSMDPRRSWSMRLRGNRFSGLQVELGRTEVESRVARFIRVFRMHNAPPLEDTAYVDLRYPNGFAMRMKTGGKTENEMIESKTSTRRVQEA